MINIKRIAERISRGDASIDELHESIITQRSFNPEEIAEVTQTLLNLSNLGLLEVQAKNTLMASLVAKAAPADEAADERTVFAPDFDFDDPASKQDSGRSEPDEATRIVDAPPNLTETMLDPDRPRPGLSAPTSLDSQRGEAPPSSSSGDSLSASSGSSWSDLANSSGSSEKLEVGSILKNRFVLEELIGVGGMGLVFKARDLLKEEAEERNPYIAIKILNDDFKRHPLSLRALQREARKSQTLAHPNIVNVFDFDRDRDNVFMTMEYLVGSPLDKAIKARSGHPFPVEEALNYIRQMAEALRYAHRLGVVHSDFKPSNVFLTLDDTLKVFDFGIARANKQGDRTIDMTVFDAGALGALTPAYASLEMLEGINPEPNDDIYALGCVAYELLTTQHPYQKKRATLALARGMKPKRIESINRRQWNAIEHALALRRQDRTQSVDEFLKQLDGKSGNSKVVYGVAAAALVLGLGLLYVPGYMERQELDELRSNLISGDSQQIDTALELAAALDPEARGPLFLSVRDQLTQYFVAQAQAAVDETQGRYGFPVAASTLDEALTYYPDSKRLADAAALITERKYVLLNELDSSFTEALDALGTAQGRRENRLEQVLQRVAQVDPGSPLLTDRRVSQAYNSASVMALANGDTVAARNLAEIGLERFPDDLGLRDQLDNVAQYEVAVTNARRVAGLESEVLDGISKPVALPQLAGLAAPLEKLLTLEPASPVVAQARAAAYPLIRTAIADSTGSYDWVAAQSLLDDYGVLLDESSLAALRGEVNELQRGRKAQLEQTMAQIRRAGQAGELTGGETSALAGLEALIGLEADSTTIAQARAVLLDGYLKRSRSYRAEKNWDAAEQAVVDGLLVAQDGVSRSRLDRESQEIARSRTETARSLAQANRDRIAAEREQQKAQLVTQIESLLATPEVSATEIQQVLSTADELVALDPTNQLASQARERMAGRVVTRARSLRGAGEFTQAYEILEQASVLIPGSQVLRGEMEELERAQIEVAQRGLEEQQQQANQTLAGLLEEPVLDERWEASIRQQLQKLEELGSLDRNRSRQINDRIGNAFLVAANESLARSRFAETRALLDRGKSYAPDLSGWAVTTAALADAQSRYAARQAAEANTAKIAGLKRTLRTQANAKAVTAARKTLQELSKLIPGDAFIEEDAPLLLGSAYASLVDAAAQREDFSRAFAMTEAGLEVAPGYAPLQERRREMLINSHTQELENYLRQVKVDGAERVRNLLADLRRMDPEGYGSKVESMVATATGSLQRLAETDPERAEAGLSIARSLFSGNRVLDQLNFDAQKQRIAEQQRKQASSQYVQRAIAEIGKSPLTIDKLSFAVQQVQQAKQTYPNNEDLPDVQAKITDSFFSLAATQQENAQLDDALMTVQEGLAFEVGNPKLLKLQKQISKQADKGKKRRRSFSSF